MFDMIFFEHGIFHCFQDAMTVIAFLKTYGLDKDFKVIFLWQCSFDAVIRHAGCVLC